MSPRLTLTFVVAGLTTGCSLTGVPAPPVAGPSELGTSLALSATPDALVQDGISRTQLLIVSRDATGAPVRGLALSISVQGDDLALDSGRLSDRLVTTDSAGEARLTYVAPRLQPDADQKERSVTFAVTPVGTNAANGVGRTVQVTLLPPGAIP
jgi:hypothetical protein